MFVKVFVRGCVIGSEEVKKWDRMGEKHKVSL